MTTDIFLKFESGMPKGTAQQKGERIAYTIKNGKRVPYIHHYKKAAVSALRSELEYKLKRYKPKEPYEGAVKLTVILYFDKKSPKKSWGPYKTTRPDCSNYVKEIEDAMTSTGFWIDDAQIADLHVKKYYAEKANIFIRVEELET